MAAPARAAVLIRPYEDRDRERAIDLLWQLNVFEDDLSGDRRRDRDGAVGSLAANILAISERGGMMRVAEIDSVVVAYMAVAFDTGPVYVRAEFRRQAWVQELVVDDGHRRRGIGRLLLAEAETFARASGVRQLMIGAIAPNAAALAAYRGFGFVDATVLLARDLGPPAGGKPRKAARSPAHPGEPR